MYGTIFFIFCISQLLDQLKYTEIMNHLVMEQSYYYMGIQVGAGGGIVD